MKEQMYRQSIQICTAEPSFFCLIMAAACFRRAQKHECQGGALCQLRKNKCHDFLHPTGVYTWQQRHSAPLHHRYRFISRSTLASPPESASWTCWACSLSSRRSCRARAGTGRAYRGTNRARPEARPTQGRDQEAEGGIDRPDAPAHDVAPDNFLTQ
jgi:hypothetical protein